MATAKEILNELPEWADAVPYQIKKIAVEDASLAVRAAIKKKGRCHYRNKKTPKQTCYIPHLAIKENGIYYRISGKLKYSEQLPENVRDSRLTYEHGRWFLAITFITNKSSRKYSENQRIVALDPGIRTFMTGFAEDSVFKIGENSFARINRLAFRMDKIVSMISKSKSRRKKRLKKALDRMKWKIWDLVDELHWKTISYLLNRYDVILLPTFETKQMSCKSNRKIHSKVVRSMSTFRFFEFSQRLLTKAKEYGKKVIRVNEAYTSKTASWTGEIKNIGSSKRITSNGISLDRDINGARGIYLRALRESSFHEVVDATVNVC